MTGATDFELAVIPRVIYHDPTHELLWREEGYSGRSKKYVLDAMRHLKNADVDIRHGMISHNYDLDDTTNVILLKNN